MNRIKAKLLLPVFTAFADGESIQLFDRCMKEWVDAENPEFSGNPNQYRIKPKKQIAYMLVDKDTGRLSLHRVFTSEEEAISFIENGIRRYAFTPGTYGVKRVVLEDV